MYAPRYHQNDLAVAGANHQMLVANHQVLVANHQVLVANHSLEASNRPATAPVPVLVVRAIHLAVGMAS